VLQAAFFDGLLLDLLSHLQDCRASTVIDICRGQVAQALVVSMVVVQFDDGTPTGPMMSGSFFIRGIPGAGGRFMSMR
jgi:hypothetical protein